MTRLRAALGAAGISYGALARELGISKASVVGIVKHGHWPRRAGELRRRMSELLAARGIDLEQTEQEVTEVRQVRISAAARKQFGLARPDPFEVRGAEDVFLGASWRLAAESMAETAEGGGMLAVIGESGAGKSTLRRYLIDRLRREGRPVRIVEPQTIDRSRLTAGSICDAIIEDLSASERPRRTLEAKARQVRRVLSQSARAGAAHVLMIEEAHDLALPTLKYLKRFWELEDGFTRLLGVVLLGQPEMKLTLDEGRAWEAREVIRRMEVVELEPLGPDELVAYLRGRGLDERAVAPAAHAAILARLARRVRGGEVSLAYPLAVGNLVRAALNLAAEMGQPQVDEHTVAAV